MSEVEGKLCKCDYPGCDEWCFLRFTGKGEMDGGFTRWNEFEPYPEGWGWGGAVSMRLCPTHFAEWEQLVDSFGGEVIE